MSPLCVITLFIIHLIVPTNSIGWDERNALDDYVWADDGYFNYEILSSFRSVTNESTIYIVNMTSQKWLDDSFSDSSIWWHFMGIAIPDEIAINHACIVFNDGGKNNPSQEPPGPDDLFATAIAVVAEDTGMIVTFVKQIPNQPVVFADDPEQKRRSEDTMIAYTWRKFLDDRENPGPSVLARFPMTKGVIKAYEATKLIAESERPEVKLTHYTVAGASKRGWTAWMVAAVDKRADMSIPIVMDLLNLKDNMKHHYRALGGWTFAFRPYYEQNLTVELDGNGLTDLAALVDPYTYMERLNETMKFVVCGASDEFFLTDDSHYFYHELPEPKYFLLLENAGHALFPHYLDILEAISTVTLRFYRKLPTPKLEFFYNESQNSSTITMRSNYEIDAAYAIVSKTVDGVRRDWRQHKGYPSVESEIEWFDYEIEANPEGDYSYTVNIDPNVWTAFFLRAEMTEEDDREYIMTSEVVIVPDNFPFPECFGEGCRGKLL